VARASATRSGKRRCTAPRPTSHNSVRGSEGARSGAARGGPGATGKVTQPFYPVAVDRIDLAKAEIAAAIAAPVSSRGGRISNAISRVENARDQIGANINFTVGSGNLFF
jgi:hypothetical protein